ncbi:MAG TPA: phage tail protein [Caulobacteraceae bacterium]|jgi:hypothetical protein
MAGRAASGVVTRYAGIQVQMSSLGVTIPVGWGTFRCRCNLVDYLDFKSTAQNGAGGGGGKGGSGVTGYNYSATVILAICEGPIDTISQVWVNGKQYAHGSVGSTVADTGSQAAPTQAGLSFSLGTIGQTPWSYLTSNHPTHAIGYSGLSLAFAANYALDSSASTPNHSFEMVRTSAFGVGATPDADPSLVVADFFQNTRTGVPGWSAGLLGSLTQYQSYTLAAGLLVSPVIDQQRSASDFLTELLRATNSTCVWSEGVLKFIPYGDTALTGNGKTYAPNNTPVYSLTDDAYLLDKDSADPPLTVDIQDQSDAYNVIQLEYLDRTNQYNMAIALASDAANVAQYGMRRKDPDTVHCVCTPAVAAISAQLYLQRTLYIRAQYKFKLGWMFALLEPGDLVELTDAGLGLAAYMVRVTGIEEDEKYGLTLTCEDYPIGVHNTPLYAMQASQTVQPNQSVDPGGVEANLLLWSQDWTNAAWTKLNLTVTTAAATSPVTGATDAQKLLPTTTSGVHRVVETTTIFGGANYICSVYVKANGYGQVQLEVSDGTNAVTALFDISAGALVSTALFSAGVLVSTSVTSAGSGWWRVSLGFQLPLTNLAARILVANGGLTSFAGNGTSSILAWGASLSQGLDIRPFAATTTGTAGPIIFNPPVSLTPGGVAMWAAVAGGALWGGANVWVSYDGANYQQVGAINGPARFGQLTASYASHADPDTTDTLSVDLSASNGMLTSAVQAVADTSGTLCLVDSELVAFETATLTAPNRYNLTSYMRRGVLNTAIAAHSAGANFVRLDDAIFNFPYLATQAGQTVFVKFQSFNPWGNAAAPLSSCIAYSAVPIPAGARPPASAAWTATATIITNGGAATPALQINGASDNASASAIEFFYRPTGTTAWITAGTTSNAATQFLIAPVQATQTYDVAVAYVVNGILGQLQIITSGGATTGGGGSGGAPGTALLNDSAPGTSKTFTCPAGSYAHADIVLTGVPGAGNGSGSKSGSTDRGGGGAGVVVVKSFPVTPGSTAFTYTLPAAVGSDATCTATGLSLAAHPGTNATTGASGAGAAASTGNTATGASSVTAYAGHNGGLVDTWDGGGPGAVISIASGAVTSPGPDNNSDGAAGAVPGQAGAGSWLGANLGGGCNLLIIARA